MVSPVATSPAAASGWIPCSSTAEDAELVPRGSASWAEHAILHACLAANKGQQTWRGRPARPARRVEASGKTLVGV